LKLKSENRMLREKVKSKQGFGGIVGRAPEMEKLYRIIAKAANSVHPVLILGESGTGKEMVARSIHYSGPFRDKPFIPVDCGSLVPTLIESELFGYVKGAFTGANQSKDGLMAMAEGGTIFLDEVGELPVDLQAKMLRAIQEKEIRPVGSTRRVPINVRILAATNRDLDQSVMKGRVPPRPQFPAQCTQPAHSGTARAAAGYSSPNSALHRAHGSDLGAGKSAQ
jgi:transcriptional regulator with GAF, ATPase, and Fis domain